MVVVHAEGEPGVDADLFTMLDPNARDAHAVILLRDLAGTQIFIVRIVDGVNLYAE